MILSSSSGRVSAIDGASEAMVKFDWVDNLEALDALGFLVLAVFLAGLSPWYELVKTKKGHSGDRFLCSSLPRGLVMRS